MLPRQAWNSAVSLLSFTKFPTDSGHSGIVYFIFRTMLITYNHLKFTSGHHCSTLYLRHTQSLHNLNNTLTSFNLSTILLSIFIK